MEIERPLTTAQAAQFLGIHRKTLERYAREGRVPACRIGDKLFRFYESQLDAWLRSSVDSERQSVPREQEIQ